MIKSFLIILCGFTAIFGLSNFLEKSRPPLPEGFEDSDLAVQGAQLKGFALGFEGLLADWYWMQSLQYIGGKMVKTEGTINLENLRPLNPRLLYPYLNNATDLDPRFMTAYSYGAIVLPGIDASQAIKITQKGIENNPREWRLYHHLGFIYWRMNEYEKAAETYERGANVADAPPFMRLMAAKMRSDGGSRETARAIYQQTFESADTQTRETLALRVLELDSLDERDRIRLTLRQFYAKNNRCAANWREVFPLLKIQKTVNNNPLRFDPNTFAPVDPTGTAYLLETDGKCDVAVDRQNSKIPIQ